MNDTSGNNGASSGEQNDSDGYVKAFESPADFLGVVDENGDPVDVDGLASDVSIGIAPDGRVAIIQTAYAGSLTDDERAAVDDAGGDPEAAGIERPFKTNRILLDLEAADGVSQAADRVRMLATMEDDDPLAMLAMMLAEKMGGDVDIDISEDRDSDDDGDRIAFA